MFPVVVGENIAIWRVSLSSPEQNGKVHDAFAESKLIHSS